MRVWERDPLTAEQLKRRLRKAEKLLYGKRPKGAIMKTVREVGSVIEYDEQTGRGWIRRDGDRGVIAFLDAGHKENEP